MPRLSPDQARHAREQADRMTPGEMEQWAELAEDPLRTAAPVIPSAFLAPVPDHAEPKREYPGPNKPLDVARVMLRGEEYDGARTIHFWRGSWMLWTGTQWTEAASGKIRAILSSRLENAIFESGDRISYWAPNRTKLGNLLTALEDCTHLDARVRAPGWIAEDGEDSSTLIPCENGIVQIGPAAGARQLLAVTPRFFNTSAVPFAYESGAREPEAFQTFLRSSLPGDQAAIDLIQEWFGYVISGRTDMQKILLLVGAKRAGKGVLERLLRQLIGPDNTAAPTLASMATNFGMSTLLNASLAVLSDARVPKRGGEIITERLLTISGEGAVDVDRKYRDPIPNVKLPTRFMMLSNELPSLEDAAGALSSRFLIVHMKESFYGREDHDLDVKLRAELPGIFNWALDGLDRLVRQGRFTVPESSAHMTDLLTAGVSPVASFLQDRCTEGPELSVAVGDLYGEYRDWCGENGIKDPDTQPLFNRKLSAARPKLSTARPRAGGKQRKSWIGLALSSDPGTGALPS